MDGDLMSSSGEWVSQVSVHECAKPALSNETGPGSLWVCRSCGKTWAVQVQSLTGRLFGDGSNLTYREANLWEQFKAFIALKAATGAGGADDTDA